MSNDKKNEPKLAPGMTTDDKLEKEATPEEKDRGETTSVTSLFLDRTPED